VVLKKPSEYFKKDIPSVDNSIQEAVKLPELNTFSDAFQSFKNNLSKIEVLSEFSETLDNYRVNIERVNFLSEKVEDIQNEIQNLLKKEDLDRAMMSQLLVVEQSIRDVQSKVKGINENSLSGIVEDFKKLDEAVLQLKEQEIPKYKRFIVETEKKTESKLNEFDEKLDTTINEVLEVVNSVEVLNSDTERKISKNIEDVQDLQSRVNIELKNVEEHKEKLSKKVIDLEVEIVRNESHIKSQNEYIEDIQEEVRDVISKLQIEKLEEKNHELTKKIKYLEEIFEKFNEKEILSENIIVEPPSTTNEDPLTPLDQNFVTLDQLNQHYRLFLNRIQQQLATIGGGGETQLKYLDDIVGIATNASAYNNKFLKYNHSIGKFEFVSVGAGSQDLNDTLQLGNSSSLGISVGVATVTSLNVDSVANFDTNTITFASSSPTQIYSFSATEYRSARLQIQITQGTDYQTSDILLIHNGSVVNIVEYASISTNDYLGTFDALISGGNVSLRVLMGSSSSSTIKVVSQAISL
jgi:hypothetical protein